MRLTRAKEWRREDIRLVYTDRVVDHVAQTGFDSRLGARPLQRVIEKEIVTPLALHLNRQPGTAGHSDYR